MNGYEKQKATSAESDNIGQHTITTSESFESYLKSRASVSVSGWGFGLAANFAHQSKINYDSNQVILIAYRDIHYGMDGMIEGNLPPLSDDAKDVLCQNPDSFKLQYGTHYIKGE